MTLEKLLKRFDRMALNIHMRRVEACTKDGKIDLSKLFVQKFVIDANRSRR